MDQTPAWNWDSNRAASMPPELPRLSPAPEPEAKRKERRFIGLGLPASSTSAVSPWAAVSRLSLYLGRTLGGTSSVAGRWLLSESGPWLLLATLGAAILAALGVGIWQLYPKTPELRNEGDARLVLDDVRDSIKVRRPPANGELSVRAATGVSFDDGHSPVGNIPPPTQAGSQKPGLPPAWEVPPGQVGLGAQGGAAKQRLKPSAFGASQLGALPDLQKNLLQNTDFHLKKTFQPGSNFIKLKNLSPFNRRQPVTTTQLARQAAVSTRAMGQLRFANDQSRAAGATLGPEGGRAFAADAFDQASTAGGQLDSIPEESTVAPVGTGAPNVVPAAGVNVTPYQRQIDQTQDRTFAAATLELLGIAAVIAGLAMIAEGESMGIAGIGLVIAGGFLLMRGLDQKRQAASLAAQAQQEGQAIASQFGQNRQAEIVRECSAQAAAQGTSPLHCRADFAPPSSGLHQAVIEESQSNYNIGRPLH